MAIYKKLMLAAGKGYNDTYWMSMYGGSNTEYSYSIFVDSSDNMYVTGKTNDSSVYGEYDMFLLKYDIDGNLLAEKLIGTASNDEGRGVVVDASGNIYISNVDEAGLYTRAGLLKLNTSYAVSWARAFGTGYTLQTDSVSNVAIDTSNNLYLTTQDKSASPTPAVLLKYNSSGVLQFKAGLRNSGSNDTGNSITIDSANNIYIQGSTGVPNSSKFIAKYNTSGVLQWQRNIDHTVSSLGHGGIAADTSSIIHVGQIQGSPYVGYVVKYNSSGTLQWQKEVSISGSGVYLKSCALDEDGNVYVLGNKAGSYGFILKLDSSGNLLWANNLPITFFLHNFDSLKINSLGSICLTVGVATGSSGGYDSWTAKLPNDGSLTGTYGSWVYSENTDIVVSSGSLTEAANGGTVLGIGNDERASTTKSVKNFVATEKFESIL